MSALSTQTTERSYASGQVKKLRGRKLQSGLLRTLYILIMVCGSIGVLTPIVWMLSTSLKSAGTVMLMPPQWIPHPLQWRNYIDAIDFLDKGMVFGNTLVIVLFSIVGQLFASTLAGFGFARIHVPGREWLFLLVLTGFMLPVQVTLIPQFVLFSKFGWIDTYYPLIVPEFMGAPFYIFLARQFFLTIPLEMDEAARVDGCGYFGIYTRIILPLSKPLLGIISIQTFMHAWNDFLRPLIFLHTSSKYTVALALQNFTADYGMTPWHLLMAATLTALLPCIALFFVAQRYFIQGIVISGVKG
ncbi:carbohydrate ABC transporter permease [Paenibacillus thalictri]|nr:carbohydrate ABC transporter permease [Paenibacillus thalictri]